LPGNISHLDDRDTITDRERGVNWCASRPVPTDGDTSETRCQRCI
jgi:hypothetical protein